MKNFSHSLPRGWWLLALLSLGGLSCSSSTKLNPVSGKVIYKNQPLAGALVTFHPKGQKDFTAVLSTGLTKDDGTFTVTTGTKSGMSAGDYVVTIICSQVVQASKGAISTAPPETTDMLQGSYSNRDTSKIAITIKGGKNDLEPFDLK